MSGTQPTLIQHLNSGSCVIVREFRGAQLALVSYDGRGGFRWTNVHHLSDKAPALKLPHAFALRIADKAAREYGADCAVLDASGALTQPASAIAKERERLISQCSAAAAMTFGTCAERMNQLGHVFPSIPPSILAEALFRLHRITKAERFLIEANGFEFGVEAS